MREMENNNQQVPPVANQPPVKTPNNLSFAKILVYGFVISSIGILIAVGGYLFGTNKTKTTTQITAQPTVTQSSPTPDETSGWQTYTNKEYGFEVKYPPDFKEQDAKSDTGLLTITKTDRGSSYYFGISVIKNYKINQIVPKTREVKEINIGNHLSYKYFYIEGLGMSEVALVQIGRDALNISFDLIGNGQNFATTNDRKIYLQDFFSQILSTFQFSP